MVGVLLASLNTQKSGPFTMRKSNLLGQMRGWFLRLTRVYSKHGPATKEDAGR